MKFTKAMIAAVTLPENKRDHIYWSDTPKGFGLRVRLGGDGKVRKNFIVQYRARGRRTRRMGLGDVEVRGLDPALAEAKIILGKVAGGGDPQGERKRERQKKDGDTLKSVVDDYLAAKRREVRKNTYRMVNLYLTGPAFKPLHGMPVDQITRKDVAARLTKISTETSSITAGRARAALSALYTWAMEEGLAESNPVIGTRNPPTSKPGERVLSDPEIAAIWNAAGDDQFGKVLRLLILTGQRRSEVGGIAWSEIGTDGIWRLPGERTKNGRAHALPLPQKALDIIATVPQVVGRDHLFGIRGARGFRDWEAKADLDQCLGDKVAPWKLHDLRRSVATGMADIGIQPHVIEVLLNHVSGHKAGVAGIYNRSSYDREVRSALALWADHVAAVVSGTERKLIPFERPANASVAP